MEVKINKEIMAYQETLFFGLSARQFVCAALAVAAAVSTFMLTQEALGDEIAGWICMAAAVPFAAAGFVTYNGMTLEKLILAVLRSTILHPRKRVYREEGVYDFLREGKERHERSRRTAGQGTAHGAAEHTDTAHLPGRHIRGEWDPQPDDGVYGRQLPDFVAGTPK